ncbi:hypothetical protein SLE2022_041680 [Rubroshorea leprosula]
MASQTCYHVRSNSLPSRPHPLASDIDEHLSRLRSFEATSTSSTSISQKLNGLQDLHDCADKFLQLPLTQEALSQQKSRKWVDELLDGSLQILDICHFAQDTVLKAKESTIKLQSVLRRRHGGEAEIVAELKKYLTSRKAVKKAISKALAKLKTMEAKCTSSSPSDQSQTKAIVGMLKQVEAVTLSVFESLLSLIYGTMDQSNTKSWSLVSKLIGLKRIACEEEERNINEFEKVDAAVKMIKSEIVIHKEMQSQLSNLESCILDLEEGLNCLSRHLIKIRVSLLNILNH